MEQLKPKRSVGRPKKGQEINRKVRVKNDPNMRWTPEKELDKMENKKKRAEVFELFPEPPLPRNFKIHKTVKGYYNTLWYHCEELGVDPKNYMLAILSLAKLYAYEEACEAELNRIKSTGAYEVSMAGKDKMFREHPAARHLHNTRVQILNHLKALGLTPTAQGGLQKDNGEENPFQKLNKISR